MDGSNSSTTDAISFYDTATQTKLWSIKNNGATVLKSLSLTGTLGVYATGASTPNIELDQNGKIICSDFQLDNESGNGFKRYGVNTAGSRMLTSSITQNGAMTCTSLAITDRTPGATTAKATIGQDGNINCEHIECTQLTVDTRRFQFPVERIVLDNVRAGTKSSLGDVSGWSFTTTAANRYVKISVQITSYAPSSGEYPWYLRRTLSGNPTTTVSTQHFFFNNANVHTVLPTLYYIDTSRSTSVQFQVRVGLSMSIDNSDRCTATVSEYY